jgi:hypothetical protein
MTGGVVLTTLLLNATTVGPLVHRLGLDEPSRSERFLAGIARLSGIKAARERLDDLDLEDPTISSQLDAAERSTHEELERIALNNEEEREVVTRRGLFVERETYQHLSDAGLLRPPATRTLLHEVDDQIEETALDRTSGMPCGAGSDRGSIVSRSVSPGGCPSQRGRIRKRSPTPRPVPGGSPRAERARRLKSSSACQGIEEEAVEDVKKTFARWDRRRLPRSKNSTAEWATVVASCAGIRPKPSPALPQPTSCGSSPR